jgi:hypothetical protein
MKTYRVKVAIRILEIYHVEAEDEEEAAESWADGDLVHTNDEALDSTVLTIKEVQL